MALIAGVVHLLRTLQRDKPSAYESQQQVLEVLLGSPCVVARPSASAGQHAVFYRPWPQRRERYHRQVIMLAVMKLISFVSSVALICCVCIEAWRLLRSARRYILKHTHPYFLHQKTSWCAAVGRLQFACMCARSADMISCTGKVLWQGGCASRQRIC